MSTITPEKMDEYKKGARLREEARAAKDLIRRRLALEVARKAAAVLKEKFGAKKVWVYGSVIHGHWFTENSDIDLAAEGLPPKKFWRAWCEVDAVDPSFEINLIDIASASESLRKAIKKEGVEL